MRMALRTLSRSPAFTATAIATIALSIALAATAFAIVDGVLFKPLPYAEARHLLSITGTDGKAAGFGPFSPADVRYLEESTPALQVTYFSTPRALRDRDDPGTAIWSTPVAHDFFDVLGQQPLVGGFTTEHFAQATAADAVMPGIVSYSFWRDHLGGGAAVFGSTIELLGTRVLVVGVLPHDFVFPSGSARTRPDILTPLVVPASSETDRWSRFLTVIARMPEGLSLTELQSRLDTALTNRVSEYQPRPNAGIGPYTTARIRALNETLGQFERPLFQAAFGGAALLILLGSINVAGLLIARFRDRQRELAVRASLGASRMTLAWTILSEGFLLALVGAGLGVSAAAPLLHTVVGLLPPLTLLKEPAIDFRVIVFGIAASLSTVLLVTSVASAGLLRPALRASLAGATTTSRTKSWTPFVVLAGESAIGLALVIGGSLTLASFVTLRAKDPGFDREHLIVVDVLAPGNPSPAEQAERLERIPDRLAAIPGVTGVARVFAPMLESAFPGSRFKNPSGAKGAMLNDVPVSENFFTVAGITLLNGRLPTQDELTQGHNVTVVSELLARTHWPDGHVIGQTLSSGSTGDTVTIVGVVREAQFGSQADDQYGEVYLPARFARGPSWSVFVVRTNRSLDETARDARLAVNTDIPGVLVRRASSLERALLESVRAYSFRSVLFGAAAGAGILVLAVGVGGLTAMGVARRLRELGIRTALGAHRAQIGRMIVIDHLRPVIAGMCAGLIGSWWAVRLLSSLLYQTDAHDGRAWVVASILVIVVTAIAASVPAHRASGVDPAVVLRAE